MKMTIREAIDYISQANGKPFTEELYDKVKNFLYELPRNPEEYNFGIITVKDYSEGWFACISHGIDENNKIYVQVVDGDNMDESSYRTKSNVEALEIMKQIKEIKYPDDYDQYWHMSDDHRYHRAMSKVQTDADNQYRELINKLR